MCELGWGKRSKTENGAREMGGGGGTVREGDVGEGEICVCVCGGGGGGIDRLIDLSYSRIKILGRSLVLQCVLAKSNY